MDQPLISIIITVLNGGKTLSSSLNSIANQTFVDFELIVVDGGSIDDTVKIINTSLVKNKTLKIRPGFGLYAGLNEGVKFSKGQWLYFMGADDQLYSENTLLIVSRILKDQQNHTMVVVGNVNCERQGYLLRPMFGSPYLLRHSVHHQGMFYRKEIFSQFSYSEDLKISSDYELNLKLALHKIPHKAIDVIVCDFGGDGISENQLKAGYNEMQLVHQRLFSGCVGNWVLSYFWLRRRVGALLRNNNLGNLRIKLKRIFG